MDAVRKQKLGQKWICYSCGAKFYDMAKAEPICPKCQVDQRTAPVVAPPKRAPKASRKKASRKASIVDLDAVTERKRKPVDPDDEDEVSVRAHSEDDVESDEDRLDLDEVDLGDEAELEPDASEGSEPAADAADED